MMNVHDPQLLPDLPAGVFTIFASQQHLYELLVVVSPRFLVKEPTVFRGMVRELAGLTHNPFGDWRRIDHDPAVDCARRASVFGGLE
jgi:hypothetical protein